MQSIPQQASHNLPHLATPFVGRKQELAKLDELLKNPACRLLTLFGPGGIGKTRLALEVAVTHLDQFSDGVYFVALEALSSPDFIKCEIAEAVGYPLSEAGDSKRQLLHYLRNQQMLLVLDNFEHLLDGVEIVGDILAAAPGVKILVTSREALNLQEEWLWPVGGMRYPSMEGLDSSGEMRLEEYSAIQLFMQHARRIRSDFSFEAERDGIVHICALVEGMPLALELAAARVRVLPCEEIAREIARNIDFLKTQARNVPPRHRSMRAVLDHSWQLLSEEEQKVFRRLSVFRGGFTREAAAEVAEAALPVLMALVDKSLVRWNSADRYSLHELVRQYAEKHLTDLPDDFGQTRGHHSAYFMGFLRQQWNRLLGSQPKEALYVIEVEIDNIRTAWGWAVVQGMEAEIDRGLDSLWFFYDTRGWYQEGEKVFALATESLGTKQPETDGSFLLGRLMARQGVLCNSINGCCKARFLLETALAIFRRLDARAETAFALARLGEVVVYEETAARARELFEASLTLYEEVEDRWGQAFVLSWLGNLNADQEVRSQQYARSLALFQEVNSQWGIATTVPLVGFSQISWSDNYQEALRLGQDGLVRCQEIGIRWCAAMSLQVMAYAAHGLGDYHAAVRFFTQSLQESLELRLERFLMLSAHGIAQSLDALGNTEQAIAFDRVAYHYYLALRGQIGGVIIEDQFSQERLAEVREQSATMDPETTIENLVAELLSAEQAALSHQQTLSADQGLITPLTERELEIVKRVSEGMSNRDIAEELFLSTGTVKWYLSQVYSKLGVNSRTQAVARVRELRLLSA